MKYDSHMCLYYSGTGWRAFCLSSLFQQLLDFILEMSCSIMHCDWLRNNLRGQIIRSSDIKLQCFHLNTRPYTYSCITQIYRLSTGFFLLWAEELHAEKVLLQDKFPINNFSFLPTASKPYIKERMYRENAAPHLRLWLFQRTNKQTLSLLFLCIKQPTTCNKKKENFKQYKIKGTNAYFSYS